MDNGFIKFVKKVLEEQEEKIAQLNESARINLLFARSFKPILLNYIDSNKGAKELCFDRSIIVKEENNHDLRQNMDEDIVFAVARKGYIYCENLSNSEILVFKLKTLTQTNLD